MSLYFHRETDLWSQLLGQLAGKNLLLILDNVEQFLTIASDLIIALLKAGNNIHVLATSHINLALAATVTFPLSGLETPVQASAHALQNESVRLFAARAARLPSPFNLESHLAEVVEICQFVQGMPLAIELAAASLDRLLVSEIMSALTRKIHFLNTTHRDLPTRQRTLHAVFDYSWQLLDPHEQRLLVQISIFRGGFTRQAADAVLTDAESSLYNLQHHALLNRDETGRFKMHPLIYQFAVEQRSAMAIPASLLAEWADRHSSYYLQLIGQHASTLQRGAPRQVLATLQSEQKNIRAAWQRAVERTSWGDIALSLEGIQLFYYRSNLFRDGIELITLALETADWETMPPQLVANLLQAKAALLQPISENEAALQAIQEALKREEIGNQTKVKAHLVWGLLLDVEGDYPASLVQYQTAAQLLAGTDDWLLQARSWQGIGWSLIQIGQLEAAGEPLQRALAFSQQADDKFGKMMSLTFLGVQVRRQNKLTQSEQYYQQALQLARSLGDRLAEGRLLANMGIAASMRFALNQALEYAEQALVIFKELNVPRNRAITEGDVGVMNAKLGNYERAQHLLEGALAVARQIEDRYGESWGLNWLSTVVLKRGDAEKGLQLAKMALVVAKEVGILSLQGGGLAKIGDALLAQGRYGEAAVSYQKAHTLFEEVNLTTEALLMLAGVAEIALRQQHPDRALSCVEMILDTVAAQPELTQSINLHVYWICHQVLSAVGDPRATAVLEAGHAILLSRADNIDDKVTRQLFLTQVATHRQILETITVIA